MAQRNDLLKGAAIGIGVAVLVPVVAMALVPIVRPMARSVLRAGLLAYEKTREAMDEVGEAVDDIKAEVEEELVEAREHAAAGAEDLEQTAAPPHADAA